jgi:DNA-directed RNA polymerase subunit M/transcription elongation factor TFIIS
MNFCKYCQSILTKEIKSDGTISFICSCAVEQLGTPADTLIHEEHLGPTDVAHREVFIENSAHDPAGSVIMKDCPQCGLDFMTLIRVGQAESVIYTCTCGAVIQHK